MADLDQNFPNINSPFVDGRGQLVQSWRSFLQTLWRRSGGASGGSSAQGSGTPGSLVTWVDANTVGDGDLTGDVLTFGSAVASIAAHSVTNAKFRQSAGRSVVGRSASTFGDVADITTAPLTNNLLREKTGALIWDTLSDLLDDVAGSTRGSVLIRGVAGWTALPPGTANFVLTSNGAGVDPSYKTVPAVSLTNASASMSVASQALVAAAAYADVTGCTLNLAAGTYLLTAQMGFQATAAGTVFGKIYNQTDAVDLTAQAATCALNDDGSMTLTWLLTIAGNKTVRLAARASVAFSVVQSADTASAPAAISTVLQAVKLV